MIEDASSPSRETTAIDTLEPVELGNTTQWIRIRGSDVSNPVLLLMQQGPGLPIINDARHLQRSLRLEEAFTLVYWDQRGTGLSARTLRDSTQSLAISPAHMVDDTISLLELLRRRFGAKPLVVGFSFGATYATYAAARRPDLFAVLVAVGMDIDTAAAEQHTYAFALDTATDRKNRRAIRQLTRIGPPPHLSMAQFRTRARWAINFGGVTKNATITRMARSLLTSMVRSPDYSIPDVLRALRGINTSQAALLPQLANTDLVKTIPRLDVPIVLAQGRLDQVSPGDATQRFHDALDAPRKELVWFEDSAHTPHLDEPAKFRDLLLALRAEHVATNS